MRFYTCGKTNKFYINGSHPKGFRYRRWKHPIDTVPVLKDGIPSDEKVTAILTRPSYFQRMKEKQEKEGFFQRAIKQVTRLFDFRRKG